MADDSLNEGSEEEKKSSGGGMSDDDFGLPDLEFDDLEELDMSDEDSDEDSDSGESDSSEIPGQADFDMSLLEGATDFSSDLGEGLEVGDLDPPENTALDQGIDEVEDVLDSAQLISDRLGDDDLDSFSDTSGSTNYDDLLKDSDSESLLGDSTSMDASDLFSDIDSPDDLAALGMAEENTDIDEVASGGSLFSADDDDDSDSIFGSDSFSLGGEEKEEFEQAEDASLPPNYKAYKYEESSGGFTKIIVIGIIAIAVVAGGLLYYNSGEDGKKASAKTEKKVVPKKVVPKKVPKKVEAADKEPVAAAKAPAKPKVEKKKVVASSANPGEIQRISARTSISYIIVGSFVDGDLAMDYAKKLSKDGKGVKIIEPYGKSKRYRVSVADFPTYGDAAGQLDSFKGEFGDQVWALKY